MSKVRNKNLNKTDLNICEVHAEKQKEKQFVLEEVIPGIYINIIDFNY